MRVERVAEVLHDVLADDVVEVALADADQPRPDRQRDHQAHVEVEPLVVPPDDDLVNEQLEQVRVDEADEARCQDRDEDDRDLRPVGAEEGDDPPDRLAAALLRNWRPRRPATERPATVSHGLNELPEHVVDQPLHISLLRGSQIARRIALSSRGKRPRNPFGDQGPTIRGFARLTREPGPDLAGMLPGLGPPSGGLSPR